MFKKIISIILALSILLVFSFSASADLGNDTFEVVDIWDYYLRNVDSYLTQIVMSFRHYDPGCPDSSSGYHSWEHRTEPYHGYFCSECGAEFRYYNVALGSMADAYDDYVEELPLDCIDDQGQFIIHPIFCFSSSGSISYTYEHWTFSNNQASYYGYSSSTSSSQNTFFYVYLPLPGSYSGTVNVVMTEDSDAIVNPSNGTALGDHTFNATSAKPYSIGYIRHQRWGSSDHCTLIFSGDFIFTPSSIDLSASYPSSSRPTELTFNLAYEDNGTYIVYNDITVINEGDSTFYNPVTNVTYDLSRWSYDYSTRTYNVTTTDDDTFLITFGDDSLIINEGGDVYELNYIVEQAPAAPCNHVYSVSDHQDPSCTLNGYTEYTCSQCGSSYRDTLFALGHVWSFVESVEAEYDENDELVADAYDLYRCIRCGLEKHEAPGSHDDSHDYSGFFSWLQKWLNDFKTWLGDKLDALLGKETEINVDVDNHTVTVINEDGEEEEVDVPDIISRFGWFKDAWAIGTYFVETVGANEQAAYNYAEVTRSGAKGGEVATGAPSIKLNLGAAQSQYGYDYGGEVEALDLSWYTPYKQTVDNLVSGFLWIVFLWNVFRHAPGIISGSGLTSNHLDDLEQGHKERKRSK